MSLRLKLIMPAKKITFGVYAKLCVALALIFTALTALPLKASVGTRLPPPRSNYLISPSGREGQED